MKGCFTEAQLVLHMMCFSAGLPKQAVDEIRNSAKLFRALLRFLIRETNDS